MNKSYINIPMFTTINEIKNKNYNLSATQYKTFDIKNKNVKCVGEFLDRNLERKDLGVEVGSKYYIKTSEYIFIKTKALQEHSYLLDKNKESIQYITNNNFQNYNLKKEDLLISKDSNVGEIAILDKDYKNAMLCGGLYRLPITNNKYYLLAFVKNEIFKSQIDFMVPRGSTIKHGKTKFLECKIPIPNKNKENTMKYIEVITKAIIEKEIKIQELYNEILFEIERELKENQKPNLYTYKLPTINNIINLDRMDSALYSNEFKKNEFAILNYLYGTSSIKELGFEKPFRGQNLQISCIGKSIYSNEKSKSFYRLILPKYLTKYGTVNKVEYIGNRNKLKTLKKGDIIFGAEGNGKGRSLVIIKNNENIITNIHGIILKQKEHNISKAIFVKLFLDYLRHKKMIDAYAVGGNGGSLAIKYWDLIKFPNFPLEIENKITSLYYNNLDKYNINNCNIESFKKYDNNYNKVAGIYELDQSKNYLQELLDNTIKKIADDIEVKINFLVE